MPELPSGTVTFLFSDVEGSTALLSRLGSEAYAAAIEEHRALMRRAVEAHDGVEVDTQGDSFFVAFSRARDAIATAREVQSALTGEIRARMGVHTGEPLLTRAGYAGMDVHRAARIAAAGHGGQVLVSQATRALIDDEDVTDLGEHRLKDLTRPERLYQLGNARFPPLKSLDRSTLPEAAHPLVGRHTEQREIASLLRQSRLVTITGAGGTGKTRLALQLAGELTDEFPDGVFFVQLGSVSDSDLVLPLALEPLRQSQTRALLVLDNFEHVLPAALAIADYLRSSPGPTLLVTSRTPLHLSMELEYALDPLPPDAAVEMFLDRARAVRRITEPSPTIDEICLRLDGLPLALELAAARLKLLDPPALLARLDRRLQLLTRGASDLPERQRTLEATIAWSYDLLDAESAEIMARLSVFAGTFDDHAAEHVAGADLDALTTLVDASLLKSRGDSRFLMLETIREFARNHLADNEVGALLDSHATHFFELAERAAPHLTGPDAGEWLARLDRDDGNVRAALDWVALERSELLPRMTIALWRFWLVRGRFEEGQIALERALAASPTAVERAELVYQLGAMVISRGETIRAKSCFQEALDRFRELGDERGEARSLSALGHVANDAGRWEEAIAGYEEAADRFRRAGDRFGLGSVLGDLATAHLRSGSPELALPLALESAGIQREHGHRQGEALALATAGYSQLSSGNLAEAERVLVASTRMAHDVGYLHGLLFSLNGLGDVAHRNGDLDRAAIAFEAAQVLRARLGIEHDPDDVLVAETRARVLTGREPVGDDFDLDRAVASALG